jgi:hypothetical protein
MEYAREIGEKRHASGGPSRELYSGGDRVRNDQVGAMAEMAVCIYYGLDPGEWVTYHDKRPGAIPDLIYEGYKVSVKSSEHWKPVTLIVPEGDTDNDIYILVSVGYDDGICGLRGWITRQDLLNHEPQPWRGPSKYPGSKSDKRWRYVPVEDLRPCKRT